MNEFVNKNNKKVKGYFLVCIKVIHEFYKNRIRTERSNHTSSIKSILSHFSIQYDNGLSLPLNELTLH